MRGMRKRQQITLVKSFHKLLGGLLELVDREMTVLRIISANRVTY